MCKCSRKLHTIKYSYTTLTFPCTPQLRAKLSSSSTPSPNKPSRGLSRGSSGAGTSGRHSSRAKATETTADGPESGSDIGDDSDANGQADPPPPVDTSERRRTRLSSATQHAGNFEDLDPFVQDVAWDIVLAYTRDVVRSNPLAERIPVTVLQETTKEIAMHVRSLVTLPLLIAASDKQWGQGGKAPEDVEDNVKKTLSIPKGKCGDLVMTNSSVFARYTKRRSAMT